MPISWLVGRKEGRCAEKAPAGEEFFPEILLGFCRMGRAARAPGRAPLHRKTPVLGERTACPPCTMLISTGLPRPKKRGVPHDFCAQPPSFRAGHGLKISKVFDHVLKSEGGQEKWKAFRNWAEDGIKGR